MNTPYLGSIFRRRLTHSLLFLLVLGTLTAFYLYQEHMGHRTQFSSGYLLAGAVVFLSCFGLRKKLNVVRFLGTGTFWLHLHVYVGFGCSLFYFVHAGLKVPAGILDFIFSLFFFSVCISGMWGLYATRSYPKKLTATRREYVYEQIPVYRAEVLNQAETLVLAQGNQNESLTEYFAGRLLPFFSLPRGIWFQLWPSGRLKRELLSELRNLDRYLAPEARSVAMKLGRLIQEKDDIDFHQALQGQLKGWLFFHIAMTYSLLILMIVHVVTKHAFFGGL